jgi:hypothetical protein
VVQGFDHRGPARSMDGLRLHGTMAEFGRGGVT